MSMRNWAEDWELCEKANFTCSRDIDGTLAPFIQVPAWNEYHKQLMQEAHKALPYWLQRVRELEEENKRLKQEVERLKKEFNVMERVATCRFNVLRALIEKHGGTVTVTKEELNIPDDVSILTECARDGGYVLSLTRCR